MQPRRREDTKKKISVKTERYGRLPWFLGIRRFKELGETLQAFLNQLALILVNRNKEPMTFVPDRRGRGWIFDQSSHELREIRCSRGSHGFGGQAGISRTSRRS
jgi:hypothetical protein